MVISDIKHCAMRAIELNPKHAQALQMMGGLLMELPWYLGGNEKKALEYLERAIDADGNFTNARVLVSKLYMKQGRRGEAKRQ
jgi:tetratricopeptide (TPR) repeat protein